MVGRKFCGEKMYTRATVCLTVCRQQAVQISHLKYSMEKNPRSLVCSQSLDILCKSRTGKRLRNRLRTIGTRKSWLDKLTTMQDTHKMFTTQKPRGSSWVGTLCVQNEKKYRSGVKHEKVSKFE